MKSRTFCALVLLLSFTVAHAQTIGVYSNDGKTWGIVDQTGKEITTPKYANPTDPSKSGFVGIFSNADKVYKLLSPTGEEIAIDLPKVESIHNTNSDDKDIKDDFFIVKIAKKVALIDKNGKVVHTPDYDKITNFFGDIAFANTGDTWFVINKNGAKTEIKEKIKDIKKMRDGLAPFTALDGKVGFLNEKGDIVIPATYTGAGYFSSGLAWVRNSDKKIGFIDKTGKLVIEAKYEVVKEFDEVGECTIARIGDKFVILKKNGTEIAVENAAKIKDFNDGISEALSGDKWGYVDNNGKWIVEAKYEKNEQFENGYGRIRLNGVWGAVDKKGTVIIEPKYTSLGDFVDGKATFKSGDKWGYVDTKGAVLVEAQYTDAKKFKNGIAFVKNGDKWGIIDSKGKELIAPKYKFLKF